MRCLWSALDHFTVAEQKRNAPQSRRANQRIDDTADDGGLSAEDGSDQIKLENADQPPVDGSDDDQKQRLSLIHI